MRFLSIILTLFSLQAFSQSIDGAWKNTGDGVTTLIMAADQYISVTTYKDNEFINTWGGYYNTEQKGQIFIDIDFNAQKNELVTTNQSYNLKIKKKSLTFDGKKFEQVNKDPANALNGLWVITGRANPEGEMGTLTPGARRTYKLMAGGYFQWLAINIQTGQFSGTGGGSYTLIDGKYTENIEFFSRDNSRVGAQLQFDASVSQNEWIHSGKSSVGAPIKEVWSRASSVFK